LSPHNEHWSTLPILVYRMLWRFFGLRTYVPYKLITILLHLTTAVLLRVVMRRAGVNPWIATAAASLFALFGACRCRKLVRTRDLRLCPSGDHAVMDLRDCAIHPNRRVADLVRSGTGAPRDRTVGG
jgi:hypothetical protein